MLPAFMQSSESPNAHQSSKPAPATIKVEQPKSPPAATKGEQSNPTPAAAKAEPGKSPSAQPKAESPKFQQPAAAGKPARTEAPPPELLELGKLEKKVADYQVAWVPAGRALALIHKKELFRHVAPTFEQYLAERWHMKRRHGLKLITAAGVVQNVREVPESVDLSLRGALELAKLPKEKQANCLRDAVALAGSKQHPTAIDLAYAVAKHLPQTKKKKSAKPKALTIKLKSGTIKLKPAADPKAIVNELTAWLASRPRGAAA